MNNKKKVYISPLFTSGKWICGGEWGTHNIDITKYFCNATKNKHHKTLNLIFNIFLNKYFQYH